jgi:nucleoside-diphosphate-sugar epimerase
VTVRILLTGATGVLGSEVRRRLTAVDGVEVTAVSRRGADGVAAWPMGPGHEPPPEVRGDWDVVIHTAADTRWNMPVDEARVTNVESAGALRHVVGPRTHLIYVSTIFAGGKDGSGTSADPDDYRNTYEWSKAFAERMVSAAYPAVTIVRPPMILGRREDGLVARFVGFYTVMKAAMTGVAPLIVAEAGAHMELVPADDIARLLISRALAGPPDGTELLAIGRGADALTVHESFTVARDTLNRWRAERGAGAIEEPPLMPVERWERFFLPLARMHLSDRQLAVLDSLSYFVPYMSLPEPFKIDVVVDDVTEPLERCVRYWADRNERHALRDVRRWSAA